MEVDMEDNDSLKNLFVMSNDKQSEVNNNENLHKSVIYVNPKTFGDNLDAAKHDGDSEIILKEILDDYMTLYKTEDSNLIYIIFKDTFSFACQIVNEVTAVCQVFCDDVEDDFPLGMEAEYFNKMELECKWYLLHLIIVFNWISLAFLYRMLTLFTYFLCIYVFYFVISYYGFGERKIRKHLSIL